MSKATLLKSIKRYLNAGGADIYEALAVETTTACDHNDCPYCYMDCRKEIRQNMTMGTARAIAAALKELEISPREIWLPGGEPMLGPRLHEIIEVLAPYSDYFALITNGQILSASGKADELAANPKIKEVAVTLHSASRATHNWLVGRRSDDQAFERSLKAIALLSRARSDLKISINLNVNHGVDFADIHAAVDARGGRIDKVMFQVVDFGVERAKRISVKDNMRVFCTPTAEMVNAYFWQAESLIAAGELEEAMMIDVLPRRVLQGVNRNYEERFYRPALTPAISVGGSFRANVVRRFE